MIKMVLVVSKQVFTALRVALLGLAMLVCGQVIAATELDFSSAPLMTSQSALWTNAGQINGTQIDVKATVLGSGVIISVDGDDAKFELRQSNMEITVSYEFFVSGTTTPITIIPRVMFKDIDTGDWGRNCLFFCSSKYRTKETVTLPESSIASYSFSTNSTLSASTSSGEITFEATSDNSSSAFVDTSVNVSFYPASSISVTYTTGDNDNRGYLFDGNIDFDFTSPNTIVFDSTAPVVPTVNGLITSEATPGLSGSAEAYSTVMVSVAGGSYEVVANASGNWSINTADDANFSPNLNGSNEVVVVSTDAAGNATSDNSNNELVIDTTAPRLSTIERLSPLAEYTNLESVLFKLTFNETVSQLDLGDFELSGSLAGASLLSLQSSDNRVYEMTVAVPAAGNGAVGLVVAAGNNIVDQVGNGLDSGAPSSNDGFIIDNVAPAAPIITSPIAGSLSIQNQISVSGTSEAWADIVVYDNGGSLCSALAGTDGVWACNSPVMSDAAHPLTAIASDAAGNSSTPSSSITVIIDANAPTAPVISSPAESAVVASNTPQFIGTGELSVSVTVSSGATALCSADTGVSGNWSCVSTVTLGEGAISISASATDSSSRTGPSSALRRFTVNALPPSSPLISSPAGGGSVGDNTPQISGTAAVGLVEVFADGLSYCSVSTDGSGNWSCSGLTSLNDGNISFTAKVTDALGDTSAASGVTLVTIDTTAPVAPSISSPVDASILALSQLDVSGSAEASSSVDVYDGSAFLCSGSADTGGAWSCNSGNLAQGEHSLTAKATDLVGNQGVASPVVTVNIDTLAPSAPIVTSPLDGAVVVSSSVTMSGTAEVGSSVSVAEAGTELCSASVQSDGSWSCVLVMGPSEGAHALTASATDEGGNTGAEAIITITLDTTAPDAPVISAPLDGSITNNQQPVFSGTAEALSSVRLESASGEGCNASADDSGGTIGNWSCTVSVVLSDADYSFSATATDSVGNVSLASTNVTLSIDTQALLPPLFQALQIIPCCLMLAQQ
ncbi:MAG: hypothetical protein JKY01_14040 [Pseudomonadales bacterium]|nr:hypothetical protein [Pseudomonadales bacterium]